MEVQTTQKYMRTSTRKLQLVASLVRKMKPAQALQTLQFTNKAAAELLSKAIETVLANAKQQGVDLEKLTFKKLEINEGPTKPMFTGRFRPGTRGRAKPYRKKMSHIKIVLTDEKVSQRERVPQVPREEKPRDTRDTSKTRGTPKKGAK